MEFEPYRRGKLLNRNVLVSDDLDVLNERLSSLLNGEDYVDLALSRHNLPGDLGIFKAVIAIERLQIVRALMRKFLAHAAVRPEPEVSFLNDHRSQKILLGYLVIPLKHNAVHFVFCALVDFVDQQNLVGLAVERGFDFGVEVALFLEIVDQILLTFPHKIAVDGSFGIDWNQLFDLPP